MSAQKTLKSFLGVRGGITVAIDEIYALDKRMSKTQLKLYIFKCSGSKENRQFARWHRKHGVYATAEQCRKFINMSYGDSDKLKTPAHQLWTSCDSESFNAVKFPSGYGHWTRGGYCPQGGYFSAMNPGYGKNPRVTWSLRTGGRIGTYGYIKPEPKKIP